MTTLEPRVPVAAKPDLNLRSTTVYKLLVCIDHYIISKCKTHYSPLGRFLGSTESLGNALSNGTIMCVCVSVCWLILIKMCLQFGKYLHHRSYCILQISWPEVTVCMIIQNLHDLLKICCPYNMFAISILWLVKIQLMPMKFVSVIICCQERLLLCTKKWLVHCDRAGIHYKIQYGSYDLKFE